MSTSQPFTHAIASPSARRDIAATAPGGSQRTDRLTVVAQAERQAGFSIAAPNERSQITSPFRCYRQAFATSSGDENSPMRGPRVGSGRTLAGVNSLGNETMRTKSAAAVIVVPGIMGSELKEGDQTVWGFKSLRWYFDVWKSNQFRSLALTQHERDGDYGRITATNLLSSPAFLAKFGKMNPYHALVNRLRGDSVHPDAVTAFPYDWRLPVAYNGALLARHIEQHADKWSNHPAARAHRAAYPKAAANVVIVAHSMGGLVAQHAAERVGVDRIIALGTPWHGSILSLNAMSAGVLNKLPFSESAVRNLTVTLPSMYDLLPWWNCMAPAPTTREDPHPVDRALIESIGGSCSLYTDATAAYADRATNRAGEVLDVIGIGQPTSASACITDGVIHPQKEAYVRDGVGFERSAAGELVTVEPLGDGTVPTFSAAFPGHVSQSYQFLGHGLLSYAAEGVEVATHFVKNTDEPTFLAGGSELGVAAPQLIRTGADAELEIVGAEFGADVRVAILDEEGQVVVRPRFVARDGRSFAPAATEEEGIFTVRVDDGHGTPVETSYMVLSE
ncbi:esterase/lipase family protein [Mycolicibacterium mageritense]|nr:hypothetical protein [Mycolicibacterium mageritense]MCC9184144.1 hypothetical protein [Mycolicibacterium mageritense]